MLTAKIKATNFLANLVMEGSTVNDVYSKLIVVSVYQLEGVLRNKGVLIIMIISLS